MPCEYWWFILGWQLSYLLLLLLSSDLQAIPFIAFWSCWECQINETNYFGQIFFLSRETLLTSRPNYTVLTPVSKTSSLGATFLIESFILPTLNKLFKKSRLMPIASSCIWNGLQLDRLNVAVISVEGMPLSSVSMSGSAAAEEESRDARGLCKCCIAVSVSLRHSRHSSSPRAPQEPEESMALVPWNSRSHGLCFLCFLVHILCLLCGEASISSSLFSLMQCKKLCVLIHLQHLGWRAF